LEIKIFFSVWEIPSKSKPYIKLMFYGNWINLICVLWGDNV